MTGANYGSFIVRKKELLLDNVLQVGQSFRWVYNESSQEYVTTMKISGQYHVVLLKQVELNQDDESDLKNTIVQYATLGDTCDSKSLESHLMDYFRMDVSVENLYNKYWLPNDVRFKAHYPTGNRMLAQEPWETLVSFICSSNNNISRITKMCHELCRNFGTELKPEIDRDDTGSSHYTFPSSDDIVNKATEDKLRELGFGYRAKYIMETAKLLVEQKKANDFTDDSEYLLSVKDSSSYIELREHLMGYTGVGPKVADCVCLMGFRHDDVVPVDVHISRIAKRDYKFQVNKKSMENLRKQYASYPVTKKKINLELDLIRVMFVKKWGKYAGWAQGILFSNEIGKSSGATTNGDVKKRQLELDIQVKEETVENSDKIKRKK
ncbi:hypothetical protein TPHA_0B00510 [Tetrapisispora phaffii CBS 4417]|uniref:DNA-(apurinic or apyrimidinic site) lyase n=1 Tax=Tetrapisispora phaffii (strain ATCC 24235 / CBS 4417 / NBRC 1672 / NRRL Y-8282 / UCD 70-5) TaxID=1071381 RepID=G8BQC6_TETPH|nr:hypothetical protein TPHA_0B00510 [Tetrapisispora phaffii CBS 4417]CCE61723.1 hypothetical protein TPHA_0B00510 [Tetrapisispora phaffii CBS 4417]